MRLIDADRLNDLAYFTEQPTYDAPYGGDYVVKMKDIDNAPTINPEDLRPKGKWIGIGYEGYADGYPVYDYWECSNCGNEEKGEDVPEANPYCRCCGAKMEV